MTIAGECQGYGPCSGGDGLGREEFVVVFPDTAIADAISVCERLRDRVATDPFWFGEESISITISVGVAHTIGEGSVASLLEEADSRLYEAKRAGRNAVRPES